MEKWHDLEYIKAAAGDRTVPVETGSNYTANDWGQKLMTVGDVITNHVRAKAAPERGLGTPASLDANGGNVGAAEGGSAGCSGDGVGASGTAAAVTD